MDSRADRFNANGDTLPSMSIAASTAFAIARFRALETTRAPSERLFDDPYAAMFYAAADADAIAGTERLRVLPNFVDAIRLRTRFTDDFVREGLRDGVKQIVLLGAGFDARALRMSEIAEHGARVYEVDFAQQLETKRNLLAQAKVSVPPFVTYVPCDFNAGAFEDDLLAALRERGLDTTKRVLFLWEGVIAYLTADAVDRSLRFMASAGGSGSRVAFDFVPDVFGNESAEDRTRRLGFARFEKVGCDALWRRYLRGEPHEYAAAVYMGTAFV
jgi:methyltransferase (TIGR00027 family)